MDWFTQNKLKANPDKFKFMLIGSPKLLCEIPEELKSINIRGQELKCVTQAKNLGLTFDERMSWEPHINELKRRCSGKLIALSAVRDSMSQKTFTELVQATAMSALDYGDIIYGNASKSALNEIQKCQNFAARVITRTRKYDHISPILNILERPTMEARRFQHRVMLVRKCVRKEVPPYLQEMFIKTIRFITMKQGKTLYCTSTG
eukprot:Seg3896.2 transcript_id=Seg3896.2/GoldUCD/mRNA.D3Y31 product="putative RNA-directed DNA polymerase from transposon BS" protein_id=Seg3896.2/GoldUCD/D3Y31